MKIQEKIQLKIHEKTSLHLKIFAIFMHFLTSFLFYF